MKYILAFSLILCFVTACTQDETSTPHTGNTKTPQAVAESLKKAYPSAEKARFYRQGENFQAKFVEGKLEREVLFSNTGTIILAEEEIAANTLPTTIQEAISTSYAGMELTEAERITKGGQVMYEVNLGRETGSLEIVFMEEGKVLTIEEEGEDDDENDDEEEDGYD